MCIKVEDGIESAFVPLHGADEQQEEYWDHYAEWTEVVHGDQRSSEQPP